MTRLLRLLRHWRLSKKHGRRLFSADTLGDCNRIIADGTARHQTDLQLAIEVALPTPAIWRHTSARTRACEIARQYHAIGNTNRCHVLIYINLADRQVDIVADTVTAQALTSIQWRTVCDRITKGFSDNDPGSGITGALRELNTLLEQSLPASG